MMFKRVFTVAGLAAMLVSCRTEPQAGTAQTTQISSQQGLTSLPLTIRSGAAAHKFRVELAETEAQQATGLMYIQTLKPDEGMIFPFVPPRPASFWMKNTMIPLDMVFVRPDCSIAKIAVNTVPQSLEPVGTEELVAAVLEVAGGRTAELGINEGDCVSWPGGPADRR